MNDAPDTKAYSPQGEVTERRRNRSFAWLLGGGFISLLGDQFSLIGLPWLTLKLTGDPLALGLMMATIGLPRAAFILMGGAFVDKFSPKKVLLISKYISTLLLGSLAYLIYTELLTLPMLYGLAAGIGLASAFAFPAGPAMLPFVVKRERLPKANSLMMGMRQVSMFIGPMLAGLIIAGSDNSASADSAAMEDVTGLALVFALDSLSFLLSALTLYMVRVKVKETPASGNVFALLFEGILNVLKDVELRSMMLYVGLIQIFSIGPIQVGMPVLAESRLDGGAAAYGTLMAFNGIGILTGLILSGTKWSPPFKTLGALVLSVDFILGLSLAGFGQITSTLTGSIWMAIVGILIGFVQVRFFSWIQQRTPEEKMGRVMSLFQLIVMGLSPLSASVAGWILVRVDVSWLFIGCGTILSLIAVTSMFIPTIRNAGRTK